MDLSDSKTETLGQACWGMIITMGGHRFAARVALGMIGCLASASAAARVRIGGSLALTQDDVFRGISWTCGGPAAQADLHLRLSGLPSGSTLFGGVWGSAGLRNSPCGATRELDPYAGYSMSLNSAWFVSLRYIHYGFPGGTRLNPDLAGARYDYDEVNGTLAYQGRLFLVLAWTPDAIRYANNPYAYDAEAIERNRSAYSFGAQWLQPLGSWLNLSASAGYDTILDPSGTGYGFWSVGLLHSSGPWQLTVAYFRTDRRATQLFGRAAAGGRIAASLLWRF